MPTTSLLDEASRIGERLVQSALHSGDSCTWYVVGTERIGASFAPRKELAANGVYQGVAGIALFLGELWNLTRDPRLLKCASGALRYVETREWPTPRLGLYTGNVGVALVAARLWELTRDDEWHHVAARQVDGLSDGIQSCHDDVISGAAGAILGLLRIDRMTEISGLRDLACRLGTRLEQRAYRVPIGWSWPSGAASVVQNLTGYAHGTAGVAHAFLELFASTGEARWRFGASRALAYERHHAIVESGDWPDFRANEVARQVVLGIPALRARLRSGDPVRSSGKPSLTRFWCHGAPGIALSRARALSLDVDTVQVRSELLLAAAATRDSLKDGTLFNYSLCHGVFGNAEAFVIARERLRLGADGILAEIVEEARSSGGSRNGGWITGVLGGGSDPSLMLGEAGIGLSLLRAGNPDIPSMLCVSNWNPSPGYEHHDVDALRQAELEAWLPRTQLALRLAPNAGQLRARIDGLSAADAEMAEMVATVRDMVGVDTSLEGPMLRDALLVDAALLDAQAAFTDYVSHFCEELKLPRLDEVEIERARIALSPHAKVLQTNWAWSQMSAGEVNLPIKQGESFVLYRSEAAVLVKQVNELQALILSSLAGSRTLNELDAIVADAITPDPSLDSSIPMYIRAVVSAAIASGIARIIDPNVVHA
ncbi:MAG: hypothetical protein JWM95_2738 [Gemmatimonadetes bacterium]|nr:hypothetical protein [Gemmatimonadota bacterium]